MTKFAVEVKPDRHEEGSFSVEITHNGYQWQSIRLTPEQARKVIAAMQTYLGHTLPPFDGIEPQNGER